MDLDPSSPSNAASATSPSSVSTPPSTTGHSSSSPASARAHHQQSQSQSHPAAKRNRAVLSCLSCRASKLRCDRGIPCGQCVKKGKLDSCSYAPKPDRAKPPAKGMASRLRRLEGLVRTMMEQNDEGATEDVAAATAAAAAAVGIQVPKAKKTVAARPAETTAKDTGNTATRDGQVIMAQNGGGSYVGATHFMAMLEDIQDMQSYFEDPNLEGDSPEPADVADTPDLLFDTRGSPRTREDFLSLLPERNTLHRLVMRYFTAAPPSCYMIHRPAFQREYARFLANPQTVPLQWLAQLFMMIALGIYYSSFTVPHELEAESSTPAIERFRSYRAIAGWSLVASKYINPTRATLTAFLLFVESEFLTSRATQTYGYLLIGVVARLMLKMGMHRDPDRLGNMSPFEGEMRRRIWTVSGQIDLLVGFHLGLPGFLFSIESDTKPPSNILDDDFDEKTEKLPPSRALSDQTGMTYPISKSMVMRVFGQAAALAHKIIPPTYNEIMSVDIRLEEVWNTVPTFMKPRPLLECITDQPSLIIQRFGVQSLYEKSKCVLHRAYLADKNPKREHDYSRRRCLDGALTLLSFQIQIYEASQPGGVLHPSGWFFKSLTVHDFLLAAMIVFLVLQNEQDKIPDNWRREPTPMPTRVELLNLLKRSREIWWETYNQIPDVTKPAEFLDTILGRLGVAPYGSGTTNTPGTTMSDYAMVTDQDLIGSLSLKEDQPLHPMFAPSAPQAPFLGTAPPETAVPPQGPATPGMLDSSWVMGGELDWKYLDTMLSQATGPDATDPNTETDWLISGPSIGDFAGMAAATPQFSSGFQR